MGNVAGMDEPRATPRDEREEVEQALEHADATSDFGTDVPRELVDAARDELAAPADETDEG
jgi:hypothetical protein